MEKHKQEKTLYMKLERARRDSKLEESVFT